MTFFPDDQVFFRCSFGDPDNVCFCECLPLPAGQEGAKGKRLVYVDSCQKWIVWDAADNMISKCPKVTILTFITICFNS